MKKIFRTLFFKKTTTINNLINYTGSGFRPVSTINSKFNIFSRKISLLCTKRISTNLIRNSSFKVINKNDIDIFNKIIGSDNVLSKHNNPNLTDKDFEQFNLDYTKIYHGKGDVVLFPSNTDQLVQIMKYCNSNKIAVVPQSGNTGLVGGSTPVFDEVIINMSKFNKILSFDELSNTVHCESGVILENLNKYLLEFQHTPPVDLGAKGSCMIGGNISTNAGGIHFIKYGSLRKNIKGIKAVLANGEVINTMNPLPKNNTGYDLKQLFCGSEGTLGIITECLLNTFPIPKFKTISLMKIQSFEHILKVYTTAKKVFAENIYAMEFFDQESMYLQVKYNNMKNPFEKSNNLEIGDIKETYDSMVEFISDLSEKNVIENAVIPEDNLKTRELWELRELILESSVKAGPSITYDVSLNLEKFYFLVEKVRKYCETHNLFTSGYGHIGDYNLHININENDKEKVKNNDFSRLLLLKNDIEKVIFDYIHSINGSVSAEHGIGRQKVKYLNLSQSQVNIELMRSIKKTMDPNGILNPYKIV